MFSDRNCYYCHCAKTENTLFYRNVPNSPKLERPAIMELIGTMKAKIGAEYNLKSSVQFFYFREKYANLDEKKFLKNIKTFRKKTETSG